MDIEDLSDLADPILDFYAVDEEMLPDFIESLAQNLVQIEQDAQKLQEDPASKALITSLFRAVHNLKGDAALCRVPLGTALAHPIESLLMRVREGHLLFSPLLSEAILLTFDKLEQSCSALLEKRKLDSLNLPLLLSELTQLVETQGDNLDAQALHFLQALSGVQVTSDALPPTGVLPQIDSQNVSQASNSQRHDLQFFEILAKQLETHSEHLRGRTRRQLYLALETNREAGGIVDENQLAAAVYLHDIGMLFLPFSLWLKPGKISEEERKQLNLHPLWAAGLLQRMQGWEGAAHMVLQHHEHPNSPYAHTQSWEEICDGAKILALVDAFEAIHFKHQDRGRKISALRAIAEINACERQFAPEWIAPFNRVIRRWMQNPEET